MAGALRIPAGGRIDRGRPLRFSFDGATYTGYAGDTLASALIANGVMLMGRSFKYHRPRGPIAAGVEEPNALVTVHRGPGRVDSNLRATTVELYDGLVATSQNRWPSLAFDAGAINDRLAPLFPAGFYYKTFMWPAGFWKSVYEPVIRRAAGLGRAPTEPDPDRYANRHAHCDVLVAGGGPAGVAAALSASETGLRVILADEQPEIGGALLHDLTSRIESRSPAEWLAGALERLASRPNVTILRRTTVFGYLNHNHIVAAERLTDHLPPGAAGGGARERMWQIRAREVVLATGAHERPLLFPDNDRPGVMLAEAARAYANRYGVRVGDRIVVFTTCDSAYRAAADLRAAGVRDVVIVEGRRRPPHDLAALAVESGITLIPEGRIVGVVGESRVRGARVRTSGGGVQTIACDAIAMSGGWTPAVHLFSQSRGRLAYDADIGAFRPDASAQAERSAGAAAGRFALIDCLADGARAGAAALRRISGEAPREPDIAVSSIELTGAEALPPEEAVAGARGRAFVDFQNDVTEKDIKLALREGFRSVEHFKRYTTNGMATDQGKTSNVNAIHIAARGLGVSPEAVGTTTFRMPYTPVTFGALIGPNRGRLFDPVRTTPIHAAAAAAGAAFEDVGLWKRAWYFPQAGEDLHAAVDRECRAVRAAVGMFDASTLGKIEVVGPDAAAFLDLIYATGLAKLAVGRSRYALLLKDDGFIYDDGIVARLAADRFHVTTTTGGAPRVLHLMEDYLQTEFTTLDVKLVSVTEQWAVIAVQGPRTREVIAPLVAGVDLSDAALPPMGVVEGAICGAPMRLFRASFTGELGYEVNVPSDHGEAVWRAIAEVGAAHGITPYGTEAMHVLRAERGFIIVGQETDGTVTPDDLGLGGMVSKIKPDFLGKRGLMRPDLAAAGRKQLVGLEKLDTTQTIEEGAQIVLDPAQPKPMRVVGHVTSSYLSATLGRAIAMALLADGRARMGETVHVSTATGFTPCRVTPPAFYDPEGARAKGDGAPFVPPAPIDRPVGARRGPLDGWRIATPGGAFMAEPLPPSERFAIKSGRGGIAGGPVAGLAFDRPINTASTDGERAALRLGPFEWLALAPEGSGMRAALEAIEGVAVVDVGHRNVALVVEGEGVEDALNAGNPLDLSLAAFPVGTATRTLLGKAEIVLWRQGEKRFRIEALRSYARYVADFLEEAARDLA
jgi:sarcosine oxidase subunit alpha